MRWLLVPLLALSWLMGSAASARAVTPQIWFDPSQVSDWLSLFQDDASWQYAARHVSVIILEPSWARKATTSDLRTVISYVQAHHKKLALALQAVQKIQTETCGGIEGYSFLGEMSAAAQAIRSAGGQLSYVYMDEPVTFGHYLGGGGCLLPVADLVTRTAAIVNSVLALFPAAVVQEIEPVPYLTENPDWQPVMDQFHIGLAQLIGQPIRMVQVDVDWDLADWQTGITQFSAYLRQRNIGLGIIYNGTSRDLTDDAWMNHAVSNIETLEGRIGIVPEQAIFASWNSSPSQNLPETLPTSATWLIDRYLLPRSRIEIRFVGRGARGRLTTKGGKPIAGARVQGVVPGVNWNAPIPTAILRGTVPSNAVSAIIGIRLNTECNCNGSNDVLLGTLKYQEVLGGTASQSWFLPNKPAVSEGGAAIGGETLAGTQVTRIIALPGQSALGNSNVFPVTPNAQYTFTVPATSVGGLGWFGYVTIIWIDQYGNGTRDNYIPPPGQYVSATAVTNPDGTFAMSKLPKSGNGSLPVWVSFDGGGAYRAVTWTPMH